MIKILTYKVSEGNLTQFGGGVNQSLIKEAEEDVNKVIEALVDEDYEIKDLKVNYFTAKQHNNGIANEVWVQFVICYNPSIFRVLREEEIEQ